MRLDEFIKNQRKPKYWLNHYRQEKGFEVNLYTAPSVNDLNDLLPFYKNPEIDQIDPLFGLKRDVIYYVDVEHTKPVMREEWDMKLEGGDLRRYKRVSFYTMANEWQDNEWFPLSYGANELNQELIKGRQRLITNLLADAAETDAALANLPEAQKQALGLPEVVPSFKEQLGNFFEEKNNALQAYVTTGDSTSLHTQLDNEQNSVFAALLQMPTIRALQVPDYAGETALDYLKAKTPSLSNSLKQLP